MLTKKNYIQLGYGHVKLKPCATPDGYDVQNVSETSLSKGSSMMKFSLRSD